jgi:hypothetical protein
LENNGHARMKWRRFGRYVIYRYLDDRLATGEYGLGGTISLSTSKGSLTKVDTSFPELPSHFFIPPPPGPFARFETLHVHWSCYFLHGPVIYTAASFRLVSAN